MAHEVGGALHRLQCDIAAEPVTDDDIGNVFGNRIALDAVIEDARRFGVDSFCAVGDLAAIGPEPVPVLERLAELEDEIAKGRAELERLLG